MECPHCGAESLMGASKCIACGQSMFGAPPASRGPASAPAPAPAREPLRLQDVAPSPPPAGARAPGSAASCPLPAPVLGERSSARRRTLCSVCFGPCTNTLTSLCDACEARASATPEPAAPGVAFSHKLGTSAFRPPPVRRGPTPGQRALRAIVWGVLFVGAGLGVVHFARPQAPGAALSQESKAQAISVDFAFPKDSVVHLVTTLDVQIRRDEIPSAFDDSMMKIFDLHQVATHAHEVMLVRDDGAAALLDVRTECRLVSQDGEWEQKDGSTRPAYPWPGWIDVQRVRAHGRGALELTSGGEPLPARDVPPFLTFGDTGAPEGELRPGTTWSTSALLPCLATRGGAITPTRFACDFRYLGRRVLDGRSCAVVRLDARPAGELGEAFEDLDGAVGHVGGALAFDADSGVLMSAELGLKTEARRGGASPDARVAVTGTLRVARP